MLSDLDFLHTLGQLERVIDISIGMGAYDLTGFLSYLGEPYTSPDSGIKRWRLPHLKRLCIRHDGHWDGLLPMLRSRYRKDDVITIEGVSIPLNGSLPSHLENLELSLRDPVLEAEVKEVVGDVLVRVSPFNPPIIIPPRGIVSHHHTGALVHAQPILMPQQPPITIIPPPHLNGQPVPGLPQQPMPPPEGP